MTPERLRQLNIEHLHKVLNRTSDPQERARIEALIEEERQKHDRDYPDLSRRVR